MFQRMQIIILIEEVGMIAWIMLQVSIKNDKDYEPNNCRWVTMKEKQNNRRNNKSKREEF